MVDYLVLDYFPTGGAWTTIFDNSTQIYYSNANDETRACSILQGEYWITGYFVNVTESTKQVVTVIISENESFSGRTSYTSSDGVVRGVNWNVVSGTPYRNKYYVEFTRGSGSFPYSESGASYFQYTIFDNKESCLNTLIPMPIVNPGVHVTFSPVYIPSFPGVHVQFNPVILNPYEPGGESEPGGGGGDYDNPTEIISLPSLPTITVEPFINLWAPQPTDMQLLANYLFSDNLWDSVTRQLFGNPIQYIVSLGIVPVPIVSQESTKETFKLATQVSDFQMYKVNSQYKEFICGTVNVPPYWGSFMDYEPHTKIQIYLPFIGFRSLSPSEVVGKSLTVVYHIDVFSGSLVAFIQSNGNLLYQFTGNCLTQMPFAASEYVNAFSGTIGALTGIGTGLIGLSGAFGAGAGALMAIGGFSSAFSSAVTVNKEQVQHGADVTSSFGLLSSRKPYLILNRPKQAIAERQNEYHGYATWYRANDFLFAKGFTKLAQIHLEGIPATDWEIQEIERLLKEGVIF